MTMASAMGTALYFFGTFNPIHWGHLAMAETARQQFGFDRVVFVPTGCPPHRQDDRSLLKPCHRLEMVRRAITDHPYFEVSDVEMRGNAGQVSYTMDTLDRLAQSQKVLSGKESGPPFPLLMGTDAFLSLPTWHRFSDLREACRFYVVVRGAQDHEGRTGSRLDGIAHLEEMGVVWESVAMKRMDISATMVRAALAQGADVRYWVHPKVREYIQQNHLYT